MTHAYQQQSKTSERLANLKRLVSGENNSAARAQQEQRYQDDEEVHRSDRADEIINKIVSHPLV